MKSIRSSGMLCALLGVGCAHNPYPTRPLDLSTHGTAVEEWAPHDRGSEWWYLTGRVHDADGKTYLFQHTIFHFFRPPAEAFMLHLAVTDLASQQHFFGEALDLAGPEHYAKHDAAVFEDNRLLVRKAEPLELEVVGRSEPVGMNLVVTATKPATWHGENGVIVMGHEDLREERSGYYSFTAMDVKGTLKVGGKDVAVTGDAWFDRQWGPFKEVGWEWFSLRFDDGRRVMAFTFPGTGAKFATVVDAEGKTRTIGDFTDARDALAYENLHTSTTPVGDVLFSLGWRLKVDGQELVIKPLQADQGNNSRFLRYWEGLCSLEDAQGNSLGHAVVETTVGAQQAMAGQK